MKARMVLTPRDRLDNADRKTAFWAEKSAEPLYVFGDSIPDTIQPAGWLKAGNLINGQWIGADKGQTYAIDDPASGAPIGAVALFGTDETRRGIGATGGLSDMVDDVPDAVARLAQRVDLITLRLFVTVCEEGNLSRAASRLRLATSAASKRLNNLEYALHVKLFVRQSKGINLTPAGALLLRHARTILSSLESMALALDGNADHCHCKVKLLANLSAIVEFLPEDLQAFFGLHSQIRLELEERPSAEVVRGIEDGVADIGICSSGVTTRGLTALPYRQDRLVVVIPDGHALAALDAISFVDTLAYDHVGLGAATSIFRQSQQAARRAGLHLDVRTHVPSFDAVCRMVQAGVGISLIPHCIFHVLGRPMGLRAIPLLDAWAERELLIIVRSPAELAPGTRLMFDHLTGVLRDN